MKKIFITGGTTGIGKNLAERYLEEGHLVGICGRDLSKLSSKLKDHHNLKTYQVDVTNREKLKKAITEFSQNGLDIMIANAGIANGIESPLPDFNISLKIIDINVQGLLHAFEASLEIMLKQGHGQLVGISSIAAFVGLPRASAYCASKSAVLTLCESLYCDLHPFNIAVTTICPGFIETPLIKKNNHLMPFLMSVEKGGKLIKQAIDKKKALYVFPFPMRMIITILNRIPRRLYRFLFTSPLLKKIYK